MNTGPKVPLADVKWRVDGKPNDAKNSVRYVPYMDATTVAALLDEWVGPCNWRDEYESAPGKGLYCHLSVRDPDGGDWVTKTDIGVPSNFEGEKGEVSDAFKRVATIKWGVGRNVYHLPTMWAACRVDQKGNAWPTDRTIPEIIQKLKSSGYDDAAAAEATTGQDNSPDTTGEDSPISPDNAEALRQRCEEKGVDVAEVVKRGTDGRTDDPAEVLRSEVGAVKVAMDALAGEPM